MKKPSLKNLEGQRKVFAMFASPARHMVTNQLMATPNSTLSQISKRTGLSVSCVHGALKALLMSNVISMNADKQYMVTERTLGQVKGLMEDAGELTFALSKLKTRAPRSNRNAPQLRAVL